MTPTYDAAVPTASRTYAIARFPQRERADGREERQQQHSGEQNRRHGRDLPGDRDWVATTTPWAHEERNPSPTSAFKDFRRAVRIN